MEISEKQHCAFICDAAVSRDIFCDRKELFFELLALSERVKTILMVRRETQRMSDSSKPIPFSSSSWAYLKRLFTVERKCLL